MNPIDALLNRVTMYRLVVYALAALTAVSVILTFFNRLSATPTELVVSIALVLAAAYGTDRVFGRIFNVATNMESSLITALILFLIVQPADSIGTGLALVLAGFISSASKFLLARNGKHIFNPAALAAAVLSVSGLSATTWWVGSSWLWPFALLAGLAVVRKIRRFPLFLTFVGVSTILQLILFIHAQQPLVTGMKHALLASPLIFLSTIMLTEPATMPPRRNLQMAFAALVAVLYVSAWTIGPLAIYPEIALLIGNIFAYLVSPKFKVRLKLKEIQQVSKYVYSYVFEPDRRFTFQAGQYMEWTLAGVPYDSRGNRRTFTIASSPTEADVILGIKYYEPASMYKATFAQLRPGAIIDASQLAGNFTLNNNEAKKLVFVAGGIGITPFRSMIKYLSDRNHTVDIILLYVVSDPTEFAYVDELKAARAVGVRTIPILSSKQQATQPIKGVLSARLDAELISKLVPDYNQRLFYVSGSNTMVDATQQYLRQLGVAHRKIKTDHFSGY